MKQSVSFPGFIYPLYIVVTTNILIVIWVLLMIKKETKMPEKSEKSNHCLDFLNHGKNGIKLLVQNDNRFQRTQLALLTIVFCLEIICKPSDRFYSLVQIGWLDWGPIDLGIYKALSSGGSSLFAVIVSLGLKKYLPAELHLFLSLFTGVISLVIVAFTNVGWMFYLGELL